MSMWDKLMGAVQSQPQAGIPEQQTFSPEQEAQAKAHGFNSANEMMLFQQNRNRPGGSVTEQGRPSMDAAMMIHPAKLLDYVLKRYSEATGQTNGH